MLIIIEGPDGVGKTTLAEALAKRIVETGRAENVELLHRGPPKLHPLDEYLVPLVDYRPGAERHVICDRWHWGEWVYPKVLGRRTWADDGLWWYLESFLRARGAVVVRPYVSLEVLTERLLHRGDQLISPEQIPALRHGYLARANASLLPYFTYSAEVDVLSLEAILGMAATAEERSVVTGGLTTYVGPPKPGFLLVGDVRNAITGPDDRRPAFMPYPATSGVYLVNSLIGSRRTQLGLMNACDVDDVVTAWHALGHPNICTLGVNAHRACRELPHSSIPHPQYVRRFHHSAGEQYGRLIDGALAVHTEALAWRP